MATSQIEENKAIIRRLFEGIDNHDLDVFDELVAEEYTTDIYRSGTEEPVGGRDGMKSLWTEYWTAFPDLEGEFLEVIAEGDRVAVFREDHGTHEGEFRGIPPTGNEITFKYAGYFVVEDGKIVFDDALGNIMSLVKQMGVELPIES